MTPVSWWPRPPPLRLLGAGLAAPWALGVLVVGGHVASGVSGPCSVAALLIAATAALLAALCHSEVFVKRHASLYEASRQVLGVRAALAVGWAAATWRVAALAACARSLGATIDYISGGHFRALTKHAMLRIFPLLHRIEPDPLAAGAACLTTLLFVLGLERSRILRLLLNASVALAVLFFIVIGATHCEPETWGTHVFLPAGARGLFIGAAMCSVGFLGVNSVRAEAARTWARGDRGPSLATQLLACVACIIACLASYLAVTVVLTMMVHFRSLSPESPSLVQAFEVRDVDWARLVMSVLGISGLSFALVELAHPLHSQVRALAADGLLPRHLARDLPITGTPAAAIVTCGAVTAALGLAAPLRVLLHIAALAALTINLTLSTACLWIRYRSLHNPDQRILQGIPTLSGGLTVRGFKAKLGSLPVVVQLTGHGHRWGGRTTDEAQPLMTLSADDSSASTDIDAAVAQFKEQLQVATVTVPETPVSIEPDATSSKRARLALLAAFVTTTFVCSTFLVGVEKHSAGALVISGLALVAVFGLMLVVAKLPRVRSTEGNFEVPFGPWIPALSVVLHVLLLVQLLAAAWLACLVLIVSGALAIYVREWRITRRMGVASRRRGERIHMQAAPPPHSMVPTLVPSHRRLAPHSQRRFTTVDTIVISR
ncbi:probable cationic amino acid transporter isoform X2 [Neocloeon triangulifer]|uniref:probable cationic amino acid transporter isoform X2 n=1 Tax=Neocloeon triangulifer TaxID=2078957 RepID=UPI00286EC552|nr:probable cationic amino acid transporter isoform X2 [Neocloeon triangulifer]